MLVLAVDDFPAGAAPTGTIGVSEVDVLVESELDEDVAGGFCPFGMTMGVVLSPPLSLFFPPLSLLSSSPSCGGQSTAVGGQLSVLFDPDESESDGGHPAPAPKSPAVVQSAPATPTGIKTPHPASARTAAARRIRDGLITSGYPRTR